MDRENVGTQQKALEINLDERKYGAFAEIGAGQEVVRWFFQVGGASGTIAKSISAYDMMVSDAIYGPSDRYVSRQRLQSMLDYEFNLTLERLDAKRGANTEFFVFADTVVARSFKGTNECHGWMGVKFQTQPHGEPSQIVVHVRMLDKDNVLQQAALGIIGVNLIHAAFFLHRSPDLLMESLLDSLSTERIEIDMIKFSGPEFPDIDHRLMSLKLVQLGLSNAAMFAADGEILQPSEVLHKKHILVERGSFRPVTYVNLDMLECARNQFIHEEAVEADNVIALTEITMSNLLATGEIDYSDFLARADILAASGATVLISNYSEYYRLAAYLRLHTTKMIGITMGIPSLRELFDEKYYDHLEGGILESFGRLFKHDTKLYIYPQKDKITGQLVNVQKLKVAPHLHNLYEHLVENGNIESIDFYNKDYLDIWSRDVLAKIRDNDPSWETMVPPEVAHTIKERSYFGYHE
ncbi:MAG: hypothetical protein JO316_24915 [Abitibacteriaceae bacterium]|nr:hypothetical protein [Abditibacteriaceae bacterium]